MAKICSNCGVVGNPKTITKGSILVEVALWVLFCLPGIIYTIWRHGSRFEGCRSCGASNLVPLNSPRGRRLQEEFAEEEEDEEDEE